MDNKTAKDKLRELRDSLSKVLDGKEYSTSKEVTKQSQEVISQARNASKTLKKSLLDRVKDIPVVNQVSQLGAAGTVAVSTAAVTQVDIAKDRTEVFVAEVAQDVVEERFEVPMFIDTFVDFHHLSDWGREVIAEKVAEVSELQSTLAPSVESSDTTPKTSSSSQDTSSDKPSVVEESNKSQESEKKQSTNKENQTSNKTDDEEKAKSEKSQSTQEEKTVNEQESQETETSSNDESQESDVNNELPIIETPFDAEDISIRQVSPSL